MQKVPVLQNQLGAVQDLKAFVEFLHILAVENHPSDLGNTF